jgi:hypothetical protein
MFFVVDKDRPPPHHGHQGHWTADADGVKGQYSPQRPGSVGENSVGEDMSCIARFHLPHNR